MSVCKCFIASKIDNKFNLFLEITGVNIVTKKKKKKKGVNIRLLIIPRNFFFFLAYED